ncbi:enoyl-CoA hydratase/isomerase family protein [Solwaraspora sp. WMMB335]|uniref:enoyl-CoA hydratase/isomerase family protein n=1 Tax=Solwaraspora sp. WMMB335 TaxID=3404118 RepID=UPI003B962098
MATTLTPQHDGRLMRVRYDNAARGNCFDHATLRELVESLEAAAATDTCVIIQLEMAGRNFCGGWDTAEFAGLAGRPPDVIAAGLRDSDLALRRVRRLPVPIVTAVRGHVIGFGAGLLGAVHLPIAATDARLSLPEARYGFAPAGVGHTITQAVPRPHAYHLLTGAATATAAQLLDWGMVARVVAGEDLDREVDALVETLLAVPAQTLRAVVEVVESSLATASPDHAYDVSARTIVAGVTATSGTSG